MDGFDLLEAFLNVRSKVLEFNTVDVTAVMAVVSCNVVEVITVLLSECRFAPSTVVIVWWL
jgi:hypothetical protein